MFDWLKRKSPENASQSFRIERHGDIAVVILSHELGTMQERHLQEARKALAPLEADPPTVLVIDLTPVGYFSSIHISFLFLCQMQADKHGSKMVLAGVSEQGRELLHLLGPPTAWPLYDTQAAALAALGDS